MVSNLFFEKALSVLPDDIAEVLRQLSPNEKNFAQELRLRINRPISIVIKGENLFITREGRACSIPPVNPCTTTKGMLEECFLRLCAYSVHSHEEELRRGYITTKNGDRAGICASAVRGKDGTLTYRDISSINLRISREVVGAAKGVLRLVDPRKGLLIAGMPSSGKTTLLRDAVRTVASGENGRVLKVAVADERYELSATSQGIPLYDLGLCSDVICGQSKAEAIEQAIRTLSPDIIACDEIGSDDEIRQLDAGLCCGAAFFATVHCGDKKDLFQSLRVKRLMDTGAFGSIILLDSPRFPARPAFIFTAEEYYAKADGTVASV
ncbi:MAG: hypothetical protein RSF82_01410 [Angelakisella sp.]